MKDLIMAKNTCTYCQGESSPRNLLQICTLPGVESVVHVCAFCMIKDYPADVEAKQAVLAAEAILAGVNGDDTFFKPLTRGLAWRAALGMI
jgi:predicted metal-binding protein